MLEYTAFKSFTNPLTTGFVANDSLFQVAAPANHNVEILGVDLSILNTTPDDEPLLFEWLLQTDNGTGGVAMTFGALDGTDEIVLVDRGKGETPQATLLSGWWDTTEPTGGNVLANFTCHPQHTALWRPKNGPLIVKGGEFVGLRVQDALTDADDLLYTVYLRE